MCSICSAATAPISSTTWTRPASAAICRSSSIRKAQPEKAGYIGHRLEGFQHEAKPLWTPQTQTVSNGSIDAMQKAVDTMKKAGLKPKRIATEYGFLPYDASKVLRAAFPDADWVDALYRDGAPAPEEVRRRTDDAENRLRSGDRCHAGDHRQDAARHDQGRGGRDAAARGNLARADLRILPDHRRHQLQPRALRADMGEGRDHVARLGRQLPRLYRRSLPHGDPGRAGCASSTICLAEIESIQHAAFKAMRPGALGGAIYAAAEPLVVEIKAPQSSRIPRATAWAWSATRRRA